MRRAGGAARRHLEITIDAGNRRIVPHRMPGRICSRGYSASGATVTGPALFRPPVPRSHFPPTSPRFGEQL